MAHVAPSKPTTLDDELNEILVQYKIKHALRINPPYDPDAYPAAGVTAGKKRAGGSIIREKKHASEYAYNDKSKQTPFNITDAKIGIDANLPNPRTCMLVVGNMGSGKTTKVVRYFCDDNMLNVGRIVIMALSLVDQELYVKITRACMVTTVNCEKDLPPMQPGDVIEN